MGSLSLPSSSACSSLTPKSVMNDRLAAFRRFLRSAAGADHDALPVLAVIRFPQTLRNRVANLLLARMVLPLLAENPGQFFLKRVAENSLPTTLLQIELQRFLRARLPTRLVERRKRAPQAAPAHRCLCLQFVEDRPALLLTERSLFAAGELKVVKLFEHSLLL